MFDFLFFNRETGEQCDPEEVVSQLNDLHLRLSDRFQLLDSVSGLQSFLQIILELVIVGDRILFLQELGFEPKAARLFDHQVWDTQFGNKIFYQKLTALGLGLE